MGASGWQHWVPYQDDVGAALSELCWDVFDSGEFYAGRGEHKVEGAESIEYLFEQLDALGHADGTHSILDMMRVGAEPVVGEVSPLTDDEIHALFETLKPTSAQIEAKRKVLSELRETGVGTYLVAYEGDEPREILFFGFSGD